MQKRKHIGLVLTRLPGYSETFLKSKINGLINDGYRVSLFVCSEKNGYSNQNESVEIYWQYNNKNLFFLIFVFLRVIVSSTINCLRFIKAEKSLNHGWIRILKNLIINANILSVKDLDWIHFEFASTGINRESVGKAIGAKVACSFRGFDICFFPYYSKSSYNNLFKSLDKVHTISDDLYKKAIKLGLDQNLFVKKIAPAIDVKFFKNDKKDKLFHKPLRILTVGRLHWVKGIDYAIDAIKILHNHGIELEYRIIGDGDYYDSISFSIFQSKIKEKIKLIGSQNRKEVFEHMKWADIYVQPSIQEGFCNAVLEAQAMKLLVISSNAGGLKENILDKKTGWIVPKRDSKSIANKILQIMSMSKKDLKIIKKNARERVVNNFSLSQQIEGFNQFYRNI